MVMFQDATVDFVRRTKANLTIIRTRPLEEGEERYEATQLINSMLGLLVMPQQTDIIETGRYLIRDLAESGWVFPRPARGYYNPGDLTALLRLMRNGIAHWGLNFEEQNGNLHSVMFKNTDTETNKVTWRARMTLNELASFVEKLSKLVLNIVERN